MKDCLEGHREEAGFSAECKDELEAMMEKRAADFRLDSTLREVLLCADSRCYFWEISSLCAVGRLLATLMECDEHSPPLIFLFALCTPTLYTL